MQYKGFTLDQFQIDSIESINKNHSVVVSAQTGTGKTLIADYLINKFIGQNKRVIYTAPIKALSNQKFKDFKNDYGEYNVGILTGDVVINSSAPILVMTTEIFRNMLITKDPSVEQISFVIFDEIHYISDIERGTVWEESIIFAPEHIRFLCLSATIPNADEFAAWISSIKKHPVDVVTYGKRAVPLQHLLYDNMLGVTNVNELRENLKIKEYHDFMPQRHGKHQGYGDYRQGNFGQKKKKEAIIRPTHYNLIKDIKDKLPAIYFIFSRKDTEAKALELTRYFDFTTKEEKAKISNYLHEKITADLRVLESVRQIKGVLVKGIGYHHAGLLPALKEIVEHLFGENLIKVLYSTETFAVGINMPAKTVCFNSLEKYDGYVFRYLNTKEYFQLAGRAGRRGIDTVGHSIAMIDRNTVDIEKIARLTDKDVEPIVSQFKLTFNTVLNLIKSHTEQEREIILKSNFDYYLRKKQNQNVRIMASYNHKLQLLKNRGFIHNEELTEKGIFATHIFFNEIILTEIFCTDLYKSLTDKEITIIIAAIVYEERRSDHFSIKESKDIYYQIMNKISKNHLVFNELNKKNLQRMINIVCHWIDGGDFVSLLEFSNYLEGDVIRLFRRIIDVLRQIRRASSDGILGMRIDDCIHRIDRGIIKVDF
ncbi:DEAD/DEAH box helicase [Candidatus Woesearchaeota archaeon]|nr:DEAD/DEAH box helicase [Candidatus Woesearchaeota archaeon]